MNRKGMWAIFLTVLIMGVFTGISIKTGQDISPEALANKVAEEVASITPESYAMWENMQAILIILGIIDLAMLGISVLSYGWWGVTSSLLTLTGAIMIPFGPFTIAGAVLVIVGALIAAMMDPSGYNAWRSS